MPVNIAYAGIDYGDFSIRNLAQDLSGTLSGAGGIGGLISVTRSTSSSTETFYPLCDGNGNICDYVDTNGNVVAHREYDAYGNTITSSGNVNDFNFWFSSKYYDQEINAYYFGYREYLVNLARWASRDPIEEEGFSLLVQAIGNQEPSANIYIFCGNSAINNSDFVGLAWKNLWRDKDHSRAPVFRENMTDTIDDLAKMIHLDSSQAYGVSGWLRTLAGNPISEDELKNGCWYSVPNEAHLTMGEANASSGTDYYSFLEKRKLKIKDVYEKKNYKVIDHDSGNKDGGSKFGIVDAVNKAGNIYVWAHYGHGVPGKGFGNLSTWEGVDWGEITPGEVMPIYRLAEVVLFSCKAGVKEKEWLNVVASGGSLWSTPKLIWPADFTSRSDAYKRLNKKVK